MDKRVAGMLLADPPRDRLKKVFLKETVTARQAAFATANLYPRASKA